MKRLGKAPKAKKKESQSKGQPTATYEYTDKDSKPLFQALRYGDGKGKTFKQRQPDGKGGWIWRVPEEVRTLYNLPAITKADQVLIVEGEKDVETARKLQVSMEITNGMAEFFGGPVGKGKSRKKVDQYEKAKELFQKYPDWSLKKFEGESGIPDSTLHRYKQQWHAEQAKKDEPKNPSERGPNAEHELPEDVKNVPNESKPFRFIGDEDGQKKPPASELSPFAKRALAEAAEGDKKRA